jgi:hypothetical protein
MSPNDDAAFPRSNSVQVELNSDYESAHRFPGWLSLSAFSAICLAALQSRRVDFNADQSGETWVLSVCIISMVLSFVAVLCYLCYRGAFVGQIPEVAIVSSEDAQICDSQSLSLSRTHTKHIDALT